jgi:hypothetical protein
MSLKAVKSAQPTASKKPRLLSELTPDELKDHLVRELGKWAVKHRAHIERSEINMFLFAMGKDEFMIQPLGVPHAIAVELASAMLFTEEQNAAIIANAAVAFFKLKEKYKTESTPPAAAE